MFMQPNQWWLFSPQCIEASGHDAAAKKSKSCCVVELPTQKIWTSLSQVCFAWSISVISVSLHIQLPNPRTIRKWLENLQCEPGFLTDVFDIIQSKESCKLYSPVIDGMTIRKQLILDPTSGIVKVYTDIGGDCVDVSKQATEALVFLLVPLTSRTRYPVGFFFVDKIDANIQSTLIRQCLQIAAERSIDVVNITCDGCSSNV